MAAKATLARVDDLDGGPADETLWFGLGGAEYEIDLNATNAAAFRRQLAPFTANARQAGARRHRAARTAASRARGAAIRAWAKAQGIAVHDRGRIPASVIQQYQAATTAR